jgi:6-hydroxytryprostatin B O-methyltransferase
VPHEGTISYPDLAAAAHVPLHQLKSITRMAITGSFLQEPVLNQVAHNKTSARFVSNPSLCDWALFLAEDSAPMAPKLVEATQRWGETTKKTETAFNLSLHTDLSFFDYLSSSPEFTQRFSGYMKNVAKGEATSIKHLVQGYDWASLGNATVVDVR